MESQNNDCIVCKTEAKLSFTDHQRHIFCNCPRCGNFEYHWKTIQINNNIIERAILSYWLQNHQSTKPIKLTRELLQIILTNTSLPRPKEQADNFILWLGGKANSPEQSINEMYNIVASIVGATNRSNVQYLIKHLKDNGLIRAITDSGNSFNCNLTFNGWERYDELQRSNKDSKLAFMAMQFNNEALTKIFDNVIKDAVTETGFEIRKLDEEHRAGSIDDKLRVEIRRSRFLISDLTDDNNGAYWEAGFAEGLGMPVIYICEASKFKDKKTHFDTNHHLTLMWKDNEESLKQFAEDLKATIRETLPDEAVMEN